VGQHQAARASPLGVLLLVRDHRHLQPLRPRLDARPGRASVPGRAATRRHHHQAARHSRSADHPRRPGDLDGVQAGRVPPGRPGRDQAPSRPRTSNDNPYSQAQFKTLKYRPEFPDRFGSFEDAHAFCSRFFTWYNHDHRHSGIAFHTPADVHDGRAERIDTQRAIVLDGAYAAHPERFVRKPPTPPELPTAAWINKPINDAADSTNP
jgi:integrase-like protein